MEDDAETSSVASSFKEELRSKNILKFSQDSESCLCLNLNVMDDLPMEPPLDELKVSFSRLIALL